MTNEQKTQKEKRQQKTNERQVNKTQQTRRHTKKEEHTNTLKAKWPNRVHMHDKPTYGKQEKTAKKPRFLRRLKKATRPITK